jgi:hypothetical protein
MSEQLESFVQQCVAMKRETELQYRMEREREQEENFEAWLEVLEKVKERLPEGLRAAVETPYPLNLDYGPDQQAYAVVRINGAANLRVYEHPGAFRSSDGDDYSRVPAFEVGSGARLVQEEDGELLTVYSWWQSYTALGLAVADAYEESLREVAPILESQPGSAVVETLLCPLLMLANDADWATINNCYTAEDQIKGGFGSQMQCKGKACAWWVRGRCAMAVLGGQ